MAPFLHNDGIEPDKLPAICHTIESGPTWLKTEEEGDMDMLHHIKTLIRDEEGASAVEYGLLVALIAAVIIVAVTAIGTNMSAKFTTVAGKLK